MIYVLQKKLERLPRMSEEIDFRVKKLNSKYFNFIDFIGENRNEEKHI